MITQAHIEIYMKYEGDGDGFIRCSTLKEKTIMNYKHWSLIDNFVQDLNLIEKGLASESFIKSVEEKIRENCDSEKTVEELKQMARIFK